MSIVHRLTLEEGWISAATLLMIAKASSKELVNLTDWAVPLPSLPPCRIKRKYLPNSNALSTVSDRRIHCNSPFLDNPTLHTSSKPCRAVLSVHESPSSWPSVLSATFSNTCHKVHDSSTEMMFKYRRALMPCSNWRDMSFVLTLMD